MKDKRDKRLEIYRNRRKARKSVSSYEGIKMYGSLSCLIELKQARRG